MRVFLTGADPAVLLELLERHAGVSLVRAVERVPDERHVIVRQTLVRQSHARRESAKDLACRGRSPRSRTCLEVLASRILSPP